MKILFYLLIVIWCVISGGGSVEKREKHFSATSSELGKEPNGFDKPLHHVGGTRRDLPKVRRKEEKEIVGDEERRGLEEKSSVNPKDETGYILKFSFSESPPHDSKESLYVIPLFLGVLWILFLIYCLQWHRTRRKFQTKEGVIEFDEEFPIDLEQQSYLERFEDVFQILRTSIVPPVFLYNCYRDLITGQIYRYHRYYRLLHLKQVKPLDFFHLFTVQLVLLMVLVGVLDAWYPSEDSVNCEQYLMSSDCEEVLVCNWQKTTSICAYNNQKVSSMSQLKLWLLGVWWTLLMTSLLDTGLQCFEEFCRRLLVRLLQRKSNTIQADELNHNKQTTDELTMSQKENPLLVSPTAALTTPFVVSDPSSTAILPSQSIPSIKRFIRALQSKRQQFITQQNFEYLQNFDLLWKVEYHSNNHQFESSRDAAVLDDEEEGECECCCIPVSSFVAARHRVIPHEQNTASILRCKYSANTSQFLQHAMLCVQQEQFRQSIVLRTHRNHVLTNSTNVLQETEEITRFIGNLLLQDHLYYHSNLANYFRQYQTIAMDIPSMSWEERLLMEKLEIIFCGVYAMLACVLTVWIISIAITHRSTWQFLFLCLAGISVLINIFGLERLDVMYVHVLLPSAMMARIRMLLLDMFELMVRYYEEVITNPQTAITAQNSAKSNLGGHSFSPIPPSETVVESPITPTKKDTNLTHQPNALQIDTSLPSPVVSTFSPSPSLASPSFPSPSASGRTTNVNAEFSTKNYFFISHTLATQYPHLLISQMVTYYRSIIPPTNLFDALPVEHASLCQQISHGFLTLFNMRWMYALPILLRAVIIRLLVFTVTYCLIISWVASQIVFVLLLGFVVIVTILVNLHLWHLQNEIEQIELPDMFSIALEEEEEEVGAGVGAQTKVGEGDTQQGMKKKRKLRNKEHVSKKAFEKKQSQRQKKQQQQAQVSPDPASLLLPPKEEAKEESSEEDRAFSISSESHSDEDDDEDTWLDKVNTFAQSTKMPMRDKQMELEEDAIRKRLVKAWIEEMVEEMVKKRQWDLLSEEEKASRRYVAYVLKEGIDANVANMLMRRDVINNIEELSEKISFEGMEDALRHLGSIEIVSTMIQQSVEAILRQENVLSVIGISQAMTEETVEDVFRHFVSSDLVVSTILQVQQDILRKAQVNQVLATSEAISSEVLTDVIRHLQSTSTTTFILQQTIRSVVVAHLKKRTDASSQYIHNVMEQAIQRKESKDLITSVLQNAMNRHKAARNSIIAIKTSRNSSLHHRRSTRKSSLYVPFPVTSITNFDVHDMMEETKNSVDDEGIGLESNEQSTPPSTAVEKHKELEFTSDNTVIAGVSKEPQLEITDTLSEEEPTTSSNLEVAQVASTNNGHDPLDVDIEVTKIIIAVDTEIWSSNESREMHETTATEEASEEVDQSVLINSMKPSAIDYNEPSSPPQTITLLPLSIEVLNSGSLDGRMPIAVDIEEVEQSEDKLNLQEDNEAQGTVAVAVEEAEVESQAMIDTTVIISKEVLPKAEVAYNALISSNPQPTTFPHMNDQVVRSILPSTAVSRDVSVEVENPKPVDKKEARINAQQSSSKMNAVKEVSRDLPIEGINLLSSIVTLKENEKDKIVSNPVEEINVPKEKLISRETSNESKEPKSLSVTSKEEVVSVSLLVVDNTETPKVTQKSVVDTSNKKELVTSSTVEATQIAHVPSRPKAATSVPTPVTLKDKSTDQRIDVPVHPEEIKIPKEKPISKEKINEPKEKHAATIPEVVGLASSLVDDTHIIAKETQTPISNTVPPPSSPQTTTPPSTTTNIQGMETPSPSQALPSKSGAEVSTPVSVDVESNSSKEKRHSKRKTKKRNKSVYVPFPRTSLFGDDIFSLSSPVVDAVNEMESDATVTPQPTTEREHPVEMERETNLVQIASASLDVDASGAKEIPAEEVGLVSESASSRKTKVKRKSTLRKSSIVFPRTSLHNDDFLTSIMLDKLAQEFASSPSAKL